METGKIEELQGVVVDEILKFIKGSKALRESKDAIHVVNLAIKTFSAIGRVKGTERARDATQFMILKTISENKKEFSQYLKVTMPHLTPPKLLSKPEKVK